MKQLYTRWTNKAETDQPRQEHPDPLMVRKKWLNLNGFWQYAITREKIPPRKFQGRIRVPFSPEALLSEVRRQLRPGEILWYDHTFCIPGDFFCIEKDTLLLHFGAVDQFCCVYVNGSRAGSHNGGYLPFTLDITPFVETGKPLHILIAVLDNSDTSYHSRGKQKLDRGGMFYTAQSGIWQTVWLESVPHEHIRALRMTPEFDTGNIKIRAITSHTESHSCNEKNSILCRIYKPVFLGAEGVTEKCCGDLLTEASLSPGCESSVFVPEQKGWTPDTPWLYPVEFTYGDDRVYSYFALRKCHIQKDKKGIPRIYLNNEPCFQAGVLDQGYWPDGLYTAPDDEAMIYDIQSMKELGFNMLRKHAKIEPARWYFHCDRMGMLVWQDMVNGGTAYKHWFVTYLATLLHYLHLDVRDIHRSLLSRKDAAGRREFVAETRETLRVLYNHPSIVCWIPFNEGWGQFATRKITALIHRLDPSRLVDSASGWYDQGGGDIKSLHYYFFTLRIPRDQRALALSEFGGYSMKVPGHSSTADIYGYRIFTDREQLTQAYGKLMKNDILPSVEKGICATIFTQLSDIEEEVNGIFTYDREILKIDSGEIRKWNELLKNPPCTV